MPSDDDSEEEEEEDVAATPTMKRLLPKKAPKAVTPVSFKRDIFKYHKVGAAIEVPKETRKSNLSRCKKKLLAALDFCGSEQHQMYMIHKVLTKGAKAGIGLGLGLLTSPIRDEAAAKKTILCIDDFLHSEEARVMGSNTNDSLAFQKTVFLLLAATMPPAHATKEEKLAHKITVRDQAALFALTKSSRQRLWQMSKIRRDILEGTHVNSLLVQRYKRSRPSMVTPENKALVKLWCETGTELVSVSPNRKDMHNVKNEYGEVTGKEKVYLYQKGKGLLYEEFIKPVEEGGCSIALDEEGNAIMKRSTFESLLPTNLRLMNKTHKQMCGCKEHQNMDFKHQALIDWRNQKMQWFERRLQFDYPPGHRHRRFTLTNVTSFKNHCYPGADGEPNWPTSDEAVAAMTCQPMGQQPWQVKYSCALGQCEDCPDLPTCFQERSQHIQEESNVISYKVICNEYRCGAHGFVGYIKVPCTKCIYERIPPKNRPTVKGKEQIVIKACSIGDFMKDVYPKQLRSYSQHRFLCRVLGVVPRHECQSRYVPGTEPTHA
jgi:hypothetical protein